MILVLSYTYKTTFDFEFFSDFYNGDFYCNNWTVNFSNSYFLMFLHVRDYIVMNAFVMENAP